MFIFGSAKIATSLLASLAGGINKRKVQFTEKCPKIVKTGIASNKNCAYFLSNVDTLECCCERKRKFFAWERKTLKYEGKLQN